MEEIKRLEKIARLLEPDAEQQDAAFRRVTDHAQDYLASIAETPAYAARADNGRTPRQK